MEITIHLGIHKTASTFLQRIYFPSLKKEITFITRQECKKFKQYLLFEDDFSFDPKFARKLFDEALRAQNHSNKAVLISDEDFYSWPFVRNNSKKKNIERLKEIFGEDQVKIILFIREQDSLCNSLYLQYVKTGGTAKFDQFVSQNIIDLNFFKYSKYISFLIEQFGKQNILIELFESFNAAKETSLERINGFLNIESNPFTEGFTDKRTNTSISKNIVGPHLFLNKISSSYKNPCGLMGKGFYKMYSKLFISLSKRIRTKDKYHLPEHLVKEIQQDNARLNDLLPELNLSHFKYLSN